MPSAPPTTRPMSGATMPTVREMRAPWMSRESMSRPRPSVPSQWAALGGMRRSSISISVGLGIGSRSATAAATTTRPIQLTASQKSKPRLGRRRTWLSAIAPISMSTSLVGMTDPGIEHGVEHVDEEIDDHEPGGHEQDDALQDHEVARIDGPDEEPADARQGEDRL